MKRLVVLAVILLGVSLFSISDTTISIADTSVPDTNPTSPVTLQNARNPLVRVLVPNEIAPGSDFAAKVYFRYLTNFDSYQFDLTYDPTVIEVIGLEGGVAGVTPGRIGWTTIPIDMWEFLPAGEPGTIRMTGNVPGDAGLSGLGYLAKVHFRVTSSAGNSSDITISAGQLLDNTGTEITPITWEGGSVYVTRPRVTVSIDAPSMVAADSEFIVKVNITEVTDFDVFQFDLYYDPTVIEVVGVEDLGRVENGTSGTLVDSDKSWTDNQWVGMYCNIVGSQPSFVQTRQITGNNSTTLTVDPAWDGIPDHMWFYLIQTTETDQVLSPGLIDSTTIPCMWGFFPRDTPWSIIVLGNVPGVPGVTGSGYLCEIHFRTVGSPGDSSHIAFSEGLLGDNMAEEIPLTAWLGNSVNIGMCEPGDANMDGVIDMADVTKVENIILNLDAETPCADANQDGEINMADVSMIEWIILGVVP